MLRAREAHCGLLGGRCAMRHSWRAGNHARSRLSGGSLLILLAALAAAAFGQTTVAPAAIPNTPAAYKDLKFPPLKQIPIPNVATYTLPNGMKLYLLEDHEDRKSTRLN